MSWGGKERICPGARRSKIGCEVGRVEFISTGVVFKVGKDSGEGIEGVYGT